MHADGTFSRTLHVALNRTYSGRAATKHRLQMEREQPCIAWFGRPAEVPSIASRLGESHRGGRDESGRLDEAHRPDPMEA